MGSYLKVLGGAKYYRKNGLWQPNHLLGNLHNYITPPPWNVGGWTFDRNSNGSAFDRDGNLITYDPHEPRYTFDPATGAFGGLMVEREVTSLARGSLDVGGAEWLNVRLGLGASGTLAGVNANRLVATSENNSHYARVGNPISYTAGRTYMLSGIFALPAGSLCESINIQFRIAAFSSIRAVSVRLFDGNVNTWEDVNARVKEIASGVYYVEAWAVASVTTTTDTGIWLRLSHNHDVTNPTFSGSAAHSVFATAVTITEDATTSTHIETTTAAVTRLADTPEYAFAPDELPTSATVIVRGSAVAPLPGVSGGIAPLLKIGDTLAGTAGLSIERDATNWRIVNRGAATETMTQSGASEDPVTIAVTWDAGTIRAAINGVPLAAGTLSWDGEAEKMCVGAGGVDGAGIADRRANGVAEFAHILPYAVPDGELAWLSRLGMP